MKKTLVALLMAAVWMAGSAQATTYFSETFEGMAIDTDITNATPTDYGSWDVSLDPNMAELKVVADPAGGGGKPSGGGKGRP